MRVSNNSAYNIAVTILYVSFYFFILVYFGVEDCTIEEAQVEAAGGKVVNPKMSIGKYGFVSVCMDTEGNLLGLSSMH